jgi:hypothetical protein
MTVPLATTTVQILRAAADTSRDYWDADPAPATVASVRAHLSSPSGREIRGEGSQQIVDMVLLCDPVDLHHDDRVKDLTTGTLYRITWVRKRYGLGLDHMVAGLMVAEGIA